MSYDKLFSDAYPKVVDMPEAEYRANKGSVETAAINHGYRLRGFRLNRAVFTTKAE